MTDPNSSRGSSESPSLLDRLMRPVAWLFIWRGGIRIAVYTVVFLVIFAGLFHLEETIRGRYIWNKYKSELQAKGQYVEFSQLIPTRVPAEQNFAMTPRLAMLNFCPETYLAGGSRVDSFPQALFGLEIGAWITNRETDFGGCLNSINKRRNRNGQGRSSKSRAPNVPVAVPTNQLEAASVLLSEFSNEGEFFDEIASAAKRPYSRFNLDYSREDLWNMRMPHIGVIVNYCLAFSARACAELALGQTDAAFEDVNTSLAISESCKSEPCGVSLKVRGRCHAITLQPIWEGLARHQWTEAQVVGFQRTLQSIDLFPQLDLVLKGEQAMGDSFFNAWLSRPSELVADLSHPEVHPAEKPIESDLLLHLMIPKGWAYMERANYGHLWVAPIVSCVNFTNKVISPSAAKAEGLCVYEFEASTNKLITTRRVLNHEVLSKYHRPSLELILSLTRFANNLHLGMTACALERYRLAHGCYPEKLESLVPEFLDKVPHDVVNGAPLKYRLGEDGRFVLYSVGWNEEDDGGSVEPLADASKTIKTQKDWVWRYP